MTYNITIEPTFQKFENKETDYRIVAVDLIDSSPVLDANLLTIDSWSGKQTISIVGVMPRLNLGKTYKAVVEQKSHPKYGISFEVKSIFSPFVSVEDKELSFLQMLVTEKQYDNIAKVYQLPITALRQGEFDSDKIKGFSKKSFEKLVRAVNENIECMEAMVELGKYGIGYNIIKKCVKYYGSSEAAVQVILENPYKLYTDISGIGWAKADAVAMALGIAKNAMIRISAAIYYGLEKNEQTGSTWCNLSDLRFNTEAALGLEFENDEDFLNLVKINKDVWTDETRFALSSTRRCEEEIAAEIKRLQTAHIEQLFPDEKLFTIVKYIEDNLGIEYTDEQKNLFVTANNNNITIFTGYAGVGKTFTLKCFLDILDQAHVSYSLAAPTAKAAKQMEYYTHRQASTIHRLLKSTGETGFLYNKNNKLPTKFLIVDETSMMDVFLFRSVLNALADGTKLILIGDTGQLPAIGVGKCLKDNIESQSVAHVTLTKVFRQALDSGALYVATQIRQGIHFYDKKTTFNKFGVKNDCTIWWRDKNNTVAALRTLYKGLLAKYSVDDIVIMSPMKKGETGVLNVNNVLQEICNPAAVGKNSLDVSRCIFRIGDRVIHTKNDKEAEWFDSDLETVLDGTGIFNGSMGKIISINDTDDDYTMFVKYDDCIIKYTKSNVLNIELAYALTVHKMQGSGFPVVIFLINTAHFMLLSRELVYTAITRTKEECFIIGDPYALQTAIDNPMVDKKNTFLCELLKVGLTN